MKTTKLQSGKRIKINNFRSRQVIGFATGAEKVVDGQIVAIAVVQGYPRNIRWEAGTGWTV